MINTLNKEQLEWLNAKISEITSLPTNDHIWQGINDFEEEVSKELEKQKDHQNQTYFNLKQKGNIMIKTIIVGTLEDKNRLLKKNNLFDIRSKEDLIKFELSNKKNGFFHGINIEAAENFLNTKNNENYNIVLSN